MYKGLETPTHFRTLRCPTLSFLLLNLGGTMACCAPDSSGTLFISVMNIMYIDIDTSL